MTKFNNLKQLLLDSRLIAETICEEGREFNPDKNSFFLPNESINYIDIEWSQIKHTGLGRRLTSYFDQLKADRLMLQNQIKVL